jgi:hypothetical protein
VTILAEMMWSCTEIPSGVAIWTIALVEQFTERMPANYAAGPVKDLMPG